MQKILLLQCAALGFELLSKNLPDHRLGDLSFKPIDSIFPAVTCTVQATMRTASPPARHGMIANGFFDRSLSRPMFWEQSSNLVEGARIWRNLRQSGYRVGQLFWQQSLGRDCDILLSPAPIHKHGGGMIDDCYSRPYELYGKLVQAIGRKFKLHWYWGPLAGDRSSRWISRAIGQVMREPAPELLLAYLPQLDYPLQKHGPHALPSQKAFTHFAGLLLEILDEAAEAGYKIVVFGDYAISRVSEAVRPNLALHQAGLFKTRTVNGRLYPDFHTSRAFAMVDHQVAHVIIPESRDITETATVLAGLRGVNRVMDKTDKTKAGLDHPRCGELVLEAAADTWFAYPWWSRPAEAPDYAGHVDIHNKPGFDPGELFFGRTPFSTSLEPAKVKGSHGLVGQGREAAWASNLESLETEPASLLELANAIKKVIS